MPLPSSGAISIADVVTYTRASASVVKPFTLGPASTQRSLSFYYNQAFIVPSTFDATFSDISGNSGTYNTSTPLSSNGNIVSVGIDLVSHGPSPDSQGFLLFVNLNPGTYKVGTRWGNVSASSQLTYTHSITTFSLGTIYSDSTLSGGSLRDNLATITIPITQNMNIIYSVQHPESVNTVYTSSLYMNIFRVS
jgi:hypothetical protein